MRPSQLILKHYNGELSQAEALELQAWKDQSPANEEVFGHLNDPEYVRAQLMRLEALDEKAGWEKIRLATGLTGPVVPASTKENDETKDTLQLFPAGKGQIPWQRYLAAAAIAVLVAVGAWLWTKYGAKDRTIAPVAVTSTPAKDIAPGADKATLTLADGSTIELDSARKGTIAIQGDARIEKTTSGQVAYHKPADDELYKKPGKLAFNTLTTPRAGQFRIILPDGSKVWLNNASSLRYPTSFPGNKREVELSGEAYFEIAKNAAAPFKVRINDDQTTVEAVGTSFNIMAYSDEAAIKTTLLTGGIKVSRGDSSKILRPGEQAQFTASGLKVKDSVNTDAVVAWKNGYFNFDKADIPAVMRQIGRWYDVEVDYEGPLPTRSFGGKIERNLNLSEVLGILKDDSIHARIEGRKLIVTR